MALKVQASAPSNIALIKYMGKSSISANLPANSSLSYTLENLRTFVEVEERLGASEGGDIWEPLSGWPPLELSSKGSDKFLSHFARLKEMWGLTGAYVLRSANNFPSDCGLASSASSFAALTRAAFEMARAKNQAPLSLPTQELARLSRLGSGSSCRSFFSPWCLWSGETVSGPPFPLRLRHAVVVVEESKKEVSSSEAHQRVQTSLLYEGRERRAEMRLQRLMKILSLSDLNQRAWREGMEILWSEFWDMHALFETSEPSFGYLNERSLRVLNRLRTVWRETGDGPWITMDAGPNVHLLLRQEQTSKASSWLSGFQVLRDWNES